MKRKKHKKRKVWPIILVVLTVLIVMAAAAVFLFRTRSYNCLLYKSDAAQDLQKVYHN